MLIRSIEYKKAVRQFLIEIILLLFFLGNMSIIIYGNYFSTLITNLPIIVFDSKI